MGHVFLGTAAGVVSLSTALWLDLPVAAALAAQSAGGIAAMLLVAAFQVRAASRRARREAACAADRTGAAARPRAFFTRSA